MRKTNNGFTIVEIIIVITVIGILSTIGVISFLNIQKFTRDKQRYNQIIIISEALEKFYDTNGRYPYCNETNNTLETNPTSVLSGTDEEVFQTPNNTTPSIKCVSSSITSPDDYFYYVTTDTGEVTEWNLKYYSELDKNISTNVIKNRRDINTIADVGNTTRTLTTNATPNDKGSITGNGTYTSGTKVTVNAVPVLGWKFDKWSVCSTSTSSTISLVLDIDKTCTANFKPATPTMTTVTANTSGDSTNWSWGAVTCPAETKAEYQYYYHTTSGWSENYGSSQYNASGGYYYTNPTTTSYQRDTYWEGFTYTVEVQAKCVSDSDSSLISDWSSSKLANYTRPMPNYTLTLIPKIGGTVSAGGTYAANSAPTITAYNNSGYTFSGWTGSSGCGGAASHSITMNENKTCTAVFTVNTPAAPNVEMTTGNTTYWKWNNTCPTGSNVTYGLKFKWEYREIGTGNWLTYAQYQDDYLEWYGNEIDNTTVEQGFLYTVYIRISCSIPGGNTSGYSYGSNTYEIGVSQPSPIVFSVKIDPANSKQAIVSSGSTCGPGATLATKFDPYSGSYKWISPPSVIAQKGWWADANNNTWWKPYYSYFGSPFITTILNQYVITSGSRYGLRVYHKCYNTNTGVGSPAIYGETTGLYI